MVKKVHKRKVAIGECATNADSVGERKMCFAMNNPTEIDYWYNKAEERKRRERY